MLSSTWYGVCKQIVVGLPLVIDYLCFFLCLSNQVCLSFPSTLGLTWLPYPRHSGLTIIFKLKKLRCTHVQLVARPRQLEYGNLCKYIVGQDTIHYRLAQRIFKALKAWNVADVVFSQKIKLKICHLVEKIKALVMGVFQYFSQTYWSLNV